MLRAERCAHMAGRAWRPCCFPYTLYLHQPHSPGDSEHEQAANCHHVVTSVQRQDADDGANGHADPGHPTPAFALPCIHPRHPAPPRGLVMP